MLNLGKFLLYFFNWMESLNNWSNFLFRLPTFMWQIKIWAWNLHKFLSNSLLVSLTFAKYYFIESMSIGWFINSTVICKAITYPTVLLYGYWAMGKECTLCNVSLRGSVKKAAYWDIIENGYYSPYKALFCIG